MKREYLVRRVFGIVTFLAHPLYANLFKADFLSCVTVQLTLRNLKITSIFVRTPVLGPAHPRKNLLILCVL